MVIAHTVYLRLLAESKLALYYVVLYVHSNQAVAELMGISVLIVAENATQHPIPSLSRIRPSFSGL